MTPLHWLQVNSSCLKWKLDCFLSFSFLSFFISLALHQSNLAMLCRHLIRFFVALIFCIHFPLATDKITSACVLALSLWVKFKRFTLWFIGCADFHWTNERTIACTWSRSVCAAWHFIRFDWILWCRLIWHTFHSFKTCNGKSEAMKNLQNATKEAKNVNESFYDMHRNMCNFFLALPMRHRFQCIRSCAGFGYGLHIHHTIVT